MNADDRAFEAWLDEPYGGANRTRRTWFGPGDGDIEMLRAGFKAGFALASAPALQAQRFSCYLERDFGKAPCDQDCGKLRCMYPSALQAGQGERYCETCERNVTEPCNSADCSTPEVAQWCVCGSPSAPNVTHRKDGPCFHEDTHQDFNPGRPDYKALYEGTLQQLKDVMRIVDGPRPSDPKSDGWKISVVGAAMATAAGKNLPNENAWLLAAYNAVVADVAASAPALQAGQGEPSADDVQAAFEAWLSRTCPSGDVEEVRRQWEASSDYADLYDSAFTPPQSADDQAQDD